MAELFVYPPRNLPGLAENWGRSAEQRDNILAKDLTQLTQKVDNGQRATGGQLAVLASQIDALNVTTSDLANRRSYTETPPNFSVTGNATVAPFPVASQTFTLPAPNIQRSASIGFTATMTNSGGTANSVSAFVELIYSGTVLSNTQISVPRPTSAPPSWVDSINFFSFAQIPAGSDPVFTVRITRVGFTAVTTTLSITNMTAFIQYGDPT